MADIEYIKNVLNKNQSRNKSKTASLIDNAVAKIGQTSGTGGYAYAAPVQQEIPVLKETKPQTAEIPTLQAPSQQGGFKGINRNDNRVEGQSQNRGQRLLTTNELIRRNEAVEQSDKVLNALKFMDSSMYIGNQDSSMYGDLKQKAEETKAKAQDMSNYSPERIAKVYEGIENHNILERIFDGNKSKEYELKQQLLPEYNNYVMNNTAQALIDSGEYENFRNTFVDYMDDVNLSEKASMPYQQRQFAERTGIKEDDLRLLANYLFRMEELEESRQYAEEHPVLSSITSLPMNLFGSMEGAMYSLGSGITGAPIDYNSNSFLAGDAASAIRGTVSEGIDNPVGSFAYNAGMSIGDSLLSQGLGGGHFGTILMGMGAYSEAAQDGAERGLTPTQIQATALAAGAAEYLFEKVSWGRLEDIAKGDVTDNLFKIIAAQAATEGMEEVGTELTNTAVDFLINGGAAEMMQMRDYYMQNGMTQEEAQTKVMTDYAKNLGLSFAGGALSGGVMGGGASLVNHVANGTQNNHIPSLFDFQQTTGLDKNISQNLLEPLGASLESVVETTLPTVESVENEAVNHVASLLDFQQENNEVHNAEHHTPEQLQVMKDYNDSSNTQISVWAERKRNGQKAFKYLPVATVNDTVADLVLKKYGLDIHGNSIGLNNSTLNHIDNNHMSNNSKSKMSNEDLERIGYVLEHPDDVVLTDDTTTATRTKDNQLAPKIIIRKRIDGHYYVVEAVTDAVSGQDVVVSAFVEKVGNETPEYKELFKGAYHVPNALENSSPLANVQNVHENSSFNSSIPNYNGNVNAQQKNTTSRTMAEDTGLGGNSVETVAELESKVRGYNESITQKSDLPTEIKNEFLNNPQMYEVLSNKDTLENANQILSNTNTNGAIVVFNRLVDQKSPVAVPLGYNLSKQLQSEGRFDEAVEVLRKMSEKLTEAGQFTQAAAITLMNNDPITALKYVVREIDNLNAKGREKFKDKWKDFELTEAEQQTFANLKPGDEQGIKDAYASIFDRIQKEYPATMREKLTELRRIDMLLNLRTNIRNIASNALLLPVRWTSDRISALGQGVLHLINPEYQRTQSLVVNKQARNLAKEAWNNVKDTLLDNEKYNDVNVATRNKQVFKGTVFSQFADNITGGAITKLNKLMGKNVQPSILETARNFTYWCLQQGDDGFVRKNFESRMASYLAAQNITNLESIPADAYTLASQEALKATFKDDTALSKTLSAVKKHTGVFGEVILPFTKTPANLAMRGYDYTIGGYIDAFKTLADKERTAADVTQTMDNLSKSVLGTAAIFAGYLLAQAGIITGPLSDDEDEAAFQKMQGMLPFSIHIGQNYYTYDWAQPAAIPIIFGATIFNATQDSDNMWNAVKQGGLAAVDSWFGLSPLQNVQDIFGGYGTPAENIMDMFMETPLSYIPAQIGALARTNDTTQRVTYSNGDVLGSLANSAASRVPFLSETLPAAYDTWGNEIKRSNSTGEAAFAQLINPGQVGNSNVTPIDGEITRLYDSTGDSAVFPKKVDWSYSIDGESIKLDNAQYSEMQRVTGQTSYDAAEHLINSAYYDSLPDDTKTDILGKAYNFAHANAKHELLGYDIANNSTYKKQYSVYEQMGVGGLVDYMGYKELADTDSSGTITQEEIKGFLSVQPNLSQEEKANWFDIYCPSAKENPFRQSGSSGVSVDYISQVINRNNTNGGSSISVDYINQVLNSRRR